MESRLMKNSIKSVLNNLDKVLKRNEIDKVVGK